jgi:hypothetical protein
MSTTPDYEKGVDSKVESHGIDLAVVDERTVGDKRETSALDEHAIASRFGPAQALLAKLFAAGVEARGIERVPETERTDRNFLDSMFLWFSVNTVLTTCACLLFRSGSFSIDL